MEAHAKYLRSEVGGRDGWVDSVKRSWKEAELSPRERALSAYAEKLTRTPWAMTVQDLEPLREAGLDDEGVLHLAHVVGYFAYANRLADGLGCDLEPEMVRHGGGRGGEPAS